MDLFERIQTVLFYMTTDRFISETQASRLLWPLLEGSPALDAALGAHAVRGPGLLAARCSEGVTARLGVVAEQEE
jgi:hypothetical protein